jgi:hypothetical protein
MFESQKEATIRGLKAALETWTWRFLAIGIVLILIENTEIPGKAAKYLSTFKPEMADHFVFEVGIAFMIAAFLLLSSERALKTEMEKRFVKYLREIKKTTSSDMDDIRKEYRSTLRNLSNVHRFSHLLSDVRDNSDDNAELCALANEVLGDYADGLKPIGNGFVIEGRHWWIEVMKRFYTLLQHACYDGLEIRVTHPDPIGFWTKSDELQDVLTAQRVLVEQYNVSIHRVFVGSEKISPHLDDNSTYAKVLSNMSKYKIQRYYVQRDDPGSVRDVTWIPKLHIFIEWSRNGSVENIKIRSDVKDRLELERMWRGLMDDVRSDRGFAAPGNTGMTPGGPAKEFELTVADNTHERAEHAAAGLSVGRMFDAARRHVQWTSQTHGFPFPILPALRRSPAARVKATPSASAEPSGMHPFSQ